MRTERQTSVSRLRWSERSAQRAVVPASAMASSQSSAPRPVRATAASRGRQVQGAGPSSPRRRRATAYGCPGYGNFPFSLSINGTGAVREQHALVTGPFPAYDGPGWNTAASVHRGGTGWATPSASHYAAPSPSAVVGFELSLGAVGVPAASKASRLRRTLRMVWSVKAMALSNWL
jgi:hypothetical protein